jgi:hypothetical protein
MAVYSVGDWEISISQTLFTITESTEVFLHYHTLLKQKMVSSELNMSVVLVIERM